MKKILAAVLAAACMTAGAGCSAISGMVNQVSGTEATPQYTLEPAASPEETFALEVESTESVPEAASQVNLRALDNVASIWNNTFSQMPDLQLVPSEAVVTAGDGMLLGGQVFEFAFKPAVLYLYLLEGQVIGARIEAHTNAWPDTEAAHEWSVMWKTMIQSVNGNWTGERYQEIITEVSAGMPPEGQEDGTQIGPVVHDSGWVYQMIDDDLGYEYVKTVSAWLSQFAGAAGRPVELEQANADAEDADDLSGAAS